MKFITDKQTLDDLNLVGKYKPDSIFNLFNQVCTKGGEQLLQRMFLEPLVNPEEINQRTLVFKFFQHKRLVFPFTQRQLASMQVYLEGNSGRNYLFNYLLVGQQKIAGALLKDENYNQILDGLRNTIVVLNNCKELLVQFDDETDHPLKDEILAAKNILSDLRLTWLHQERGRSEWRLATLSKYDLVLRSYLREELQQLLEIIYRLDVYIAVGNLAGDRGFAYANALSADENVLKAEDIKHPGLSAAVGNPVSFDTDHNLIFLTGANMAGKSTFMKSFGISLYLAHMGFPLAVRSMEFSVRSGMYTSINVPDNLNQGYSHFYAEVLRVKAVAEQVSFGHNLLVIFDELFKGTNVKDAYDATLAVTAAFAAYRNCIFIISTHIIEAGEVLRTDHPGMQFKYMPTEMHENKPVYTYQIRDGISEDRHGMVIIENEGILDMLLDEYKPLDNNKTIYPEPTGETANNQPKN